MSNGRVRTIGHLVADIQKSESEDDALQNYAEEASSKNLSTRWIVSVFCNRRPLPVLDESFDVHSHGVSVLTQIGIPEDKQTQMWEAWPTLPEDVRAAWVEGFKLLDMSDPIDVESYAMLLVDLLTSQ